jgi:hypothetical protein
MRVPHVRILSALARGLLKGWIVRRIERASLRGLA